MSLLNKDFFKNIYLLKRIQNIIPSYKISSLDEIFNHINPQKTKGIIFDIDQTITPYGRVDINVETINVLKKLNITYKCCFLSNYPKNNKSSERLDVIQKITNLPLIISAEKKPAPGAFAKAKEILNLEYNEIAMVGDQLFTDVLGANSQQIKTILIKPIDTTSDPFFMVRVPRLIEQLLLLLLMFFGVDKNENGK